MGSQRVSHDWVTELYWEYLFLLISTKKWKTYPPDLTIFFDDAHWLTLYILPKMDFFSKNMTSMAVSPHPAAMLAVSVFEITPKHVFSSVQSLSRVWFFATLLTAARQASLCIINSQSLPKLMSIKSVMPSNHLILCHPLLLPSIFPRIRVFSNESALHIRWSKYWSFSFNISLSNEHSGLISFMMDWLDLLAVQGTLKGLLQLHSSKTSVLWCSAFFIVQFSYP